MNNLDGVYIFSINGLLISYSFSISPRRLLYSEVTSNIMSDFRVYLITSKGIPLYLNDVETNYVFILKGE